MFSRSSEFPSGTAGGSGHSEYKSLLFIVTISARTMRGKLERLLSCGDGIVYKSFMKMEWFAPVMDQRYNGSR